MVALINNLLTYLLTYLYGKCTPRSSEMGSREALYAALACCIVWMWQRFVVVCWQRGTVQWSTATKLWKATFSALLMLFFAALIMTPLSSVMVRYSNSCHLAYRTLLSFNSVVKSWLLKCFCFKYEGYTCNNLKCFVVHVSDSLYAYNSCFFDILCLSSFSSSCESWAWNKVELNRTRKPSKAQCDGRPPLSYRRRTFVATWENLVATATGVGYRVVFEWYHYIARPLKSAQRRRRIWKKLDGRIPV